MKKHVFLVPLLLALVALPLSIFADDHLAAAPKAAAKEAVQHQPGPHHGGEQAAGHHGTGHPGHGDASGAPPGHGEMMEKCKEMRAKHEQMEAEMKAMDARLDEKVAAMNAAGADQKVEAMSAVITELVTQRKEMREKMGLMHHGRMCMMMCPMMGQGGKPMGKHGRHHGGRHGMGAMDCPMMKHHGETMPQSGGDTPEKKGEAS